jgi:arylsulfatase A-like enzyme
MREGAPLEIRPNRRRARRVIAALIPLLALAGCGPEREVADRTSETVVIISIDTARRDHLSVYDYPLSTTPNIERLAADGVVFDQAIAVHTNTAPAHASILTGLYPPQHGSMNNAVPIFDTVPTLAEILTDRGFATAAFVSGQTLKAEVCGLDRGFSIYDDRFDGWERRAASTEDLARDWLTAQEAGRPLFLFFHLFDPHFIYSPPGRFASFGLDEGEVAGEPLPADRLRESVVRDAEPWRRSMDEWTRRYDGEIAYADWAVGQLVTVLNDLGRYSTAIIIVVSDHGETLTERPRVLDHGGRVTEEQIRIPLIVKLPDRSRAGSRVEQQVSQIDIVPTVLAELDLPVPESLPGVDLRDLVQRPPDHERPLFCMARREPKRLRDLGFEVPDQRRWDGPESMLAAVRLPPYKLVDYAFLLDRDLQRLRNLERDPEERRFADNRAVESELARLLEAWWQRSWSGDSSSGTELDGDSIEMLQALGYMEVPEARRRRSGSENRGVEVFRDGFEAGAASAWSGDRGGKAEAGRTIDPRDPDQDERRAQ